jgi:hypothetical protein
MIDCRGVLDEKRGVHEKGWGLHDLGRGEHDTSIVVYDDGVDPKDNLLCMILTVMGVQDWSTGLKLEAIGR